MRVTLQRKQQIHTVLVSKEEPRLLRWLRMAFGAVAHNVGHLILEVLIIVQVITCQNMILASQHNQNLALFVYLFAADLRDFTYANANDTYCNENKGSRDVSRRDLIGVGNWVFSQLIQEQTSFQ